VNTRSIVPVLLALALVSAAWAAPPPLRTQLSLNGDWEIGGTVPQYFGIETAGETTLERTVTTPAAWRDKVVRVEFAMVNHVADVYVDGQLRVRPAGGVWLRAYGAVHIQEAFIRTSVRTRTIPIDYTLHIADRNHPSVYMWNATNEMTYSHLSFFSKEQCRRMGNAIRLHDPTRPLGYDGDRRAAQEIVNYHYAEGYNKEPVGSIYDWAGLLTPDRPTGSGGTLHTRSPDPDVQQAVERNTWWLGIWLRGLRYTGWSDVRPACFWFVWKEPESGRSRNLVHAYAPVALFDKEYDDLGIAPYVTGTTPGSGEPGQPLQIFFQGHTG